MATTSQHPPATVWRAIELYMSRAYGGTPPAAVRGRLETLRRQPDETFYDSPVFERDAARPPARYGLRLGNERYPHMKLALQRSPDDATFLFKADTHDSHCCPGPASPEYARFLSLMQANEALAKQIEAAWEAAGLPTFKQFLRDDLARRQAAAAAHAAP